MARLARLTVPHQPHHILQRGVSGQSVFQAPEDYQIFLDWLKNAAKQFAVAIHAYVLMPDHFHLLLTPSDDKGLGRMMQWAGRHYVPYFNLKYQRVGTLWQGRYRATVIEAERYFLMCSRYIELNPVRTGLCMTGLDYPWSSYAHHVGAKVDPLITDHATYWALGNTPFQREASYKDLSEQAFAAKEVQILNDATLKGWALGSDAFKARLERQSMRRVAPIKRGRPPKAKAQE